MIDPMVFYWIGLAQKIEILCMAIIVVAFVLAIVMLAMASDAMREEEVTHAYRYFKVSLIAILVSSGIYTLIPSNNTMYMMVAAKYVTVDNVNEAGTIIANNVEKIVKAVNSCK